MKLKLILFATLFVVVVGCKKDEGLSFSNTSQSVDYKGGVVNIELAGSASWQVSPIDKWCSLKNEDLSGTGGKTISINVDPNLERTSRKGGVVITDSSGGRTEMSISQSAAPAEGYRYQIPVVFHTLYSDQADKNQYISAGRFKEIIDYCNKMYSKSDNDMNFEFVLATHDPKGNAMSEPGVNRIKVLNATYDASAFMLEDNETRAAAMLWDCNKYINLYTYKFKDSQSYGIAFLAFATVDRPLDGLTQGSYFLYNSPTYLRGVHLNNIYAYEDMGVKYNDADFKITVAHELGHFLGLLHAFSANGCMETDYCDDTPNYDREAYDRSIYSSTPFEETLKRTACDGREFISENIMDYGNSLYTGFTPNQRARVRHVLENSPLIPGPKNISTKSYFEYEKPEPTIIE